MCLLQSVQSGFLAHSLKFKRRPYEHFLIYTHFFHSKQHIWCFGPALRMVKINCAVFRTWNRIVLSATLAPLIETLAGIFTKIKVRHQALPEKDDDAEDDILVV